MKNQKKNNEEMQQTNIFELLKEKYTIANPIRLIELFAGIGSQAKALKNLNVNFEHYKIVEFDKYAIASYNAIHGTNFETQDITKIGAKDLEIVDTDKYDYILTYSFPCTDLSLAGDRKGMTKGSGTRSGLLWEVERLLDECLDLPQILLMENVPQVINKDFHEWQLKLESLGYSNYTDILNAKDFEIPQNRNRCFMVSILGDYSYKFPQKKKLKLRLKDLLEDDVDEKYYLSEKLIKCLTDTTNRNGLIRAKQFRPHNPNESGIAYTVTPKAGSRPCDNFIEVFDFRYDEGARGRVELEDFIETKDGIMPTLTTRGDTFGVATTHPLRIRKLTPKECWRLMGFDDEDFEKASKVNSNAQLYKQAGNSIVVNVLMAIFKEIL